jgi:hypothetical protein
MQEEEISQTPPSSQQQQPPKRILAVSKRGDAVWNVCQPILDYLIEYGDEETNRKAIKTRAYWEQRAAVDYQLGKPI